MTDEDAFLRTILDNPEDDAPRLIYADWLEERGDDASAVKAGFLRDTARVLTAKSNRRKRIQRRLHRVAQRLDARWLAVVGKIVIERCTAKFRYVCPRRWEKLQATDDVRVRYCDGCEKAVHYCDSMADAWNHASHGHCVALSLSIPREPNDLAPPRRYVLGIFEPEPSVRDAIEESEQSFGGVR